ncbi:putative Alpha/beta-hydrolase [Seiridium cardinale]
MALALHRFERFHAVFKTINDNNFEAAILVPRSIPFGQTTNSPLLAHFHGGALMQGTILEPCFLSLWPLELAETENAIIVSPAYRLLPEAKGTEILDDVRDFWIWVHSKLPAIIADKWPHITVNLGRVACFGESAGGYLTLQSAMLFPEAKIKVALPQYAAMYPDIKQYNEALPISADEKAQASAGLDKYMSTIRPGAIRLTAPFPEFSPIVQNTIQSQRHRELLGDDKRMTLDYGLKTVKNLPPIWYLQGTDDKIVACAASNELIDRLRKSHPETPLLYSVQPGDHGFDSPYGLATPYIAEGIEFVRRYW